MKSVVFVFLALFFFACSHNSPVTKQQPPKILLLGLDGVGYTQFRKMQEGGHFRSFRQASPLVSTFPSISDPNWSLIMRAPVEVSFTKEHFDRKSKGGNGEMKGSLIDHVLSPPQYEKNFDFRPEGAVESLASMTYAETTGLYWLDALEQKLLAASGKNIFSGFIVNTDFIAHTKGEKAIYKYLGELDKKIELLRQRYRLKYNQDLEVVLVSDHGNVFLKPKAVDVESILKEDSWTADKSILSDRHVVYVVPEILSFAPFFVTPGQEANLAKSVSKAEGVHVAVFLSGADQVDIIARGGADQSRVKVDPTKKILYYEVIKGKDPLHHEKYFKKGTLSFIRYFQETLHDEFPNALVRIWEGLTQVTQQKPSVLASPRLGYVFSNKTLELITTLTGLESVHGSLHREETLGIFVSTDRELPPVHPSAVMDYIN